METGEKLLNAVQVHVKDVFTAFKAGEFEVATRTETRLGVVTTYKKKES